ncbi:MAG: hypothetical protein GY832_31975 [Chloroflexi bacterium]|nr:hypothetical protein [Chloroflexota bacterium]
MKSVSLLFLLLLPLVVGCAPSVTPEPVTAPSTAPPQVEPEEPWKVIRQVEGESGMTSVGFLDGDSGVALAFEENTYTADGGDTWITATRTVAAHYGLDIVDKDIIWSMGNFLSPQIQVSTDGGQNWQGVTNVTYSGVFISFIDAQTGWAAAHTNLWKTADGGQIWTEIDLPEGIDDITGINLRTADDGYLLDSAGILYTTQDGGATWSSQTLGLDKDILIHSTSPYIAIRFFDADRGVIVLSLAGEKGNLVALRTGDGGQTWEREEIPAKIGALHLTHDGAVLTSVRNMGEEITILRYQGN